VELGRIATKDPLFQRRNPNQHTKGPKHKPRAPQAAILCQLARVFSSFDTFSTLCTRYASCHH